MAYSKQHKPRKANGFTIIEVLIVVAILGILAAIATPIVTSHIQHAKESVAKDNLRTIRNAIDLYTAQHDDPPSYLMGYIIPESGAFTAQLTGNTSSDGRISGPTPDPSYEFGQYIAEVPENPLNDQSDVLVILNGQTFPAEPPGGGYGWIYKPSTKEFKLNSSGTDDQGVEYYEY